VKKLFIVIFSLVIGIVCPLSAMAAPHIVIDGRTIVGLPPVVIQDGSALVPMRAIFSHLGAKVEWDSKDQTITAIGNGNRLVMAIGQTTANLNGKTVTLSVSPQIINGVALVPLRVVAEAMNTNVRWDSKSELVDIKSSKINKSSLQKNTFEVSFDSPKLWSGQFGEQTSDGGYLVIGSTNNVIPKLGDLSQKANTGILMWKMKSSGGFEWQKQYGNSGWNFACGLKSTSDGGFVLIAYVPGTQDRHRCAAIKFNKTGQQEWISVCDPSIIDIRHIDVTGDGGYIITAVTEKNHPYVQKLDGKGQAQWDLTLDASSSETIPLLHISQAADGSYRLLFAPNDVASIITIDANGKVKGEQDLSLQGIVADGAKSTSDGGYILSGTVKQSDRDGQAIILKIDSAGKIIWEQAPENNDDIIASVSETTDGGYIAAGRAVSFGPGMVSGYLMKLDKNGRIVWKRAIGTHLPEFFQSVEQTSDGGYLLVGTADYINSGIYVVKTDANGDVYYK